MLWPRKAQGAASARLPLSAICPAWQRLGRGASNLGARWASVPLTRTKRVLGMYADGLSYRLIVCNVGLSKT